MSGEMICVFSAAAVIGFIIIAEIGDRLLHPYKYDELAMPGLPVSEQKRIIREVMKNNRELAKYKARRLRIW